MNVFLIISILIIVVGLYMMFVEFTTERYYSSAIIDFFLFNHKKWKLYQKAKKAGVKHYLTPYKYEEDKSDGTIPDYYLYPIIQEDGGIHYLLYTKDNEFITGNFYLTERL